MSQPRRSLRTGRCGRGSLRFAGAEQARPNAPKAWWTVSSRGQQSTQSARRSFFGREPSALLGCAR